MSKKQVAIKIGSDVKEAKNGINAISEQLNNLAKQIKQNKFEKLASSFTLAGRALGTAKSGVNAVQQAFSDLTEAYNTQKKAETQLETAAKVNPYLNDYSVSKLKAFASELQSISTYGDEQLLPLMAELAAAGRTQAEITEIMSAAVDVAASGTMSLDTAVKGLNSTYSGSAGQLGKLLPQVKNLSSEELKSGKAVKEVANAFKGQAQAVTKATGGWQQFKNAYGDFKELMGKSAADLQNKVGTVLAGVFTSVTEKLTEADTAAQSFKATLAAIAAGTGAGATKTEAEQSVTALTESLEKYNKLLGIIDSSTGTVDKTEKDYTQSLREEYAVYKKTDAEYTALIKQRKALEAESNNAGAGGRTASEIAADYESVEKKIAQKEKQYTDAIKNAKSEYAELVNLFMSSGGEGFSGSYKALKTRIQSYTDALEKAQDKLAEAQTAEAKNTSTALSDADKKAIKAREAYDKTVTSKKQELELEKQIDSTFDQKKADAELYSTMVSAYIKMIVDAEGTLSGNLDHEKNARAEIAALAEKTAEATADTKRAEEAKKAYTELEKELSEIALTEGEKLDLYDQQIKALETQRGKISELAAAAKESFVNADGVFDEEAWNKYADKVAAAQKALEDKRTALMQQAEEERSQSAIQSAEETLQIIQNLTSEWYSALSELSSTLCDLYENEATVKQASIEEAYANGEISAEEYAEQTEEIEKEAAEKSYQIQMWEWGANVLNAQAQVALAALSVLADPTLATWAKFPMLATVAATGAIQLASLVAAKPTPPSFATGGIVGGNSYTGDRVQANVNSGEMILNAAQQKELWLLANGRQSQGSHGGVTVNVHNTQARDVTASVQQKDDGSIELLIQKTVSKQLQNGTYNRALMRAQSSFNGTRYTN
ncbi:MAG: hypothetical protein K6G80_00075 [Treponema sp.]|nr:hypothetical protein [Treponema sp.]